MTASEPRLQRPEPELLPDFIYWEVTLRFKNEEMKEVVLCPFIHVKVLDAKKKELESDAYIGAGFVSEDLIDDIDRRIVVVPAGKTVELAVNLGNNDMGDHLVGWDFEQAGTYTVQLSYDYDRNAFQKTFFQAPFIVGKEKLDWARTPERNWNRAVEMKRTAEVKLVKPK